MKLNVATKAKTAKLDSVFHRISCPSFMDTFEIRSSASPYLFSSVSFLFTSAFIITRLELPLEEAQRSYASKKQMQSPTSKMAAIPIGALAVFLVYETDHIAM